MEILHSEAFKLRDSDDVVTVRQAARKLAVTMGFGIVDQTKIVTAASEIGRNTVDHGGGGTAVIETIRNGQKTGLRQIFEDHGPGIPDLALALTDGYTTGGGMGLGLSGTKRLSHEFEITSTPGEGTRIAIVRWK